MNHKLVHQIKVDFNVTPEIKRFVYIYIITGQKGCYLIDSGVDGAEQIIENYLRSIGREMTDIKAVFLTHAHPDHIGAAWKIKEISGCKVYSGKGEQRWMEDIDLQYKERQIPNFYSLVNKSVELDGVLSDGDTIELETGITINVLSTPGHSCDELSYVLEENKVIFTGDTIPVKEDIPIWINEEELRNSLKKLQSLKDIDLFYPAWDKTYDKDTSRQKIKEAYDLIEQIRLNVNLCMESEKDLDNIVENVCDRMGTKRFMKNPLFQKTILSFFE